MKCLKLTSGSRYIFTKDELESLKILMRTIVYSNTNLKIDLKLTETENTIVLHDAGARNEDVMVADWDAREGKDDFDIRFTFADVEIDEKLQIPVSDDWHVLFSSAILGRIQAITNAEYSVDKSTLFNPKVAPSFSVDILGKSYLIYQKFNTITDNSGKPRQIPAGVYAKLASSVNLTDERMIEKIRPVKRMNDSWVVYGDTPNQKSHEHGHASRILKNKDMLEEFGLNVAETSKLWDLMEQRKIVPIFTMDVTIDACAARSIEFIETILAENKYNPKFTKSNIIL